MPTLVSYLNKTAEQYTDHIAIVFNETKIEYGRLYEAVKRLAKGLQNLGIEKGDRVALMLPNVPHFCIVYYGILEIGAVVVPINIMFEPDEIKHHLMDSGAKVLISWIGFQTQILSALESMESKPKLVFLGNNIPKDSIALTQLIAQSQPLQHQIEISDDDLAVINYTSGISDAPLGAELTHAALANNVITYREMFRISKNENIIAALPLFHPLGHTMLMGASFVAGASISLLPKYSPDIVVQTIKENNTSFFAAAPSMFKDLADYDVSQDDVNSLKFCISYGGKLDPQVIEDFEKKYPATILEAYGLSEAGPLVACNRVDRDRKFGSVGLPIIGVEIEIRNNEGIEVRQTESGEIWVKGPGLMKQYYNKPQETTKKLVNDWLFTGDIGYLDEDYYLHIQQRKEDIIVKGGFHIFPEEIEKILLEHTSVYETAVIGVPDKIQGSEVKAFVVLKESLSCTSEELDTFCRNRLPVYKIPKHFEFSKEIPKSPTGRVLKRVLRMREQEKNRSTPN